MPKAYTQQSCKLITRALTCRSTPHQRRQQPRMLGPECASINLCVFFCRFRQVNSKYELLQDFLELLQPSIFQTELLQTTVRVRVQSQWLSWVIITNIMWVISVLKDGVMVLGFQCWCFFLSLSPLLGSPGQDSAGST